MSLPLVRNVLRGCLILYHNSHCALQDCAAGCFSCHAPCLKHSGPPLSSASVNSPSGKGRAMSSSILLRLLLVLAPLLLLWLLSWRCCCAAVALVDYLLL